MDRRRFLKYAATGLVAATAAGAGYYFYGRRPSPTRTEIATSGGWESAAPHPGNNAPIIWAIEMKPKYVNPTTETVIRLSHSSSDWDNDPLWTTWLIDWKEASHEPDYSTKLPEGVHAISLKVSDGKSEATKYTTVTVEPDQIYPTKQLRIKHKGMRMMVGWKGMRPIPIDITEQKLDIIRNELGCNAVIIFGDTELEHELIEAGRLAIQKGFDRIYVAPCYLDLPVDETIQRIGEFAKRVRTLRLMSDAIVFMVGHEFTLDTYGIVPGETYADRIRYVREHADWMEKVYAVLPDMFRKIVELCRENYGYQIAYAATIWEAEDIVPWSDPIFESVGSDAYVEDWIGWTENWITRHLSGLKRYRKPVNSTEWGCLTYKGAREQASSAFLDEDLAKYPYDEDDQASYIGRYCEMLNRANVSGAFYTQLDDERLKGYGLYKASSLYNPLGAGSSRKKGFYMYKSYQRSS